MLLVNVHEMLAKATAIPQLALEKREGDMLGEAICEVQRHYPALGMSPKAMAWTGLISCAGMVYLPRLAVIRLQATAARRAKAAPSKAGPEVVEPVAGFSPPFPPDVATAFG